MTRKKLKNALFKAYENDNYFNVITLILHNVVSAVFIVWTLVNIIWYRNSNMPTLVFYMPMILLFIIQIILDINLKYFYFKKIDTYHELLLLPIPNSYAIIVILMLTYSIIEGVILLTRNIIIGMLEINNKIITKKQEIKTIKLQAEERIKKQNGQISICENNNLKGGLSL